MNKTEKHETATRLLNRQAEITNQLRSIVPTPHHATLLTTEEIVTVKRLSLELELHDIEAETFLADVAAHRSIRKFLKRYIFNNN